MHTPWWTVANVAMGNLAMNKRIRKKLSKRGGQKLTWWVSMRRLIKSHLAGFIIITPKMEAAWRAHLMIPPNHERNE